MGAFTAGLFHGIGNIFAGAGRSLLTRMEDIGAHGLAGGISSIIGGGKFGAGFFSAGFSEFASPLTLGLNSAYEGAFASAMIGGTASVISGGKFVNGAETGAFSFIFNDWAHAYQQAKSEAKAWVQRIGEAWDQYSDTINLGLNEFAIAGLFVPGVGELEAGAIIAEEALAVDEVANGADDIFKAGRTPKASELKKYAEGQGWKRTQTKGGPLKYVDENGIPRLTIKQGSSRTPGSSNPHVELKDATGQRIDFAGNLVNRKSPGNHTPIDYDL